MMWHLDDLAEKISKNRGQSTVKTAKRRDWATGGKKIEIHVEKGLKSCYNLYYSSIAQSVERRTVNTIETGTVIKFIPKSRL